MNSKIDKGVIKWIASLRGILVFLVFFSHLTMLSINRDLLFIIGRIGVAGFFLISGYLAVTSLEKRNVWQFLLNRFIRIYPIYWILLLMKSSFLKDICLEELIWNFSLFEEFVGFDAIIGSSWMLPIMVVFFLALVIFKNKFGLLFYLSVFGSLALGILRYISNKPYPTAFCLLICVGLLGLFQMRSKQFFDKKLLTKFLLFEITLAIASFLSYGNKVYWYFIAYNISFFVFFLFQKYNISFKPFEKLGELGFTFFLGAGIPMKFMILIYPDIIEWNCYFLASIKFISAILFSYLITIWIEKPLLLWGKSVENNSIRYFNDKATS